MLKLNNFHSIAVPKTLPQYGIHWKKGDPISLYKLRSNPSFCSIKMIFFNYDVVIFKYFTIYGLLGETSNTPRT